MKNRLVLYLTLLGMIIGCRDNSTRIYGNLTKPYKGEYLYLLELQANELKTIDSLKLTDDGKFDFKKKISLPTFFLLRLSNNNFFTMLAEPGEKIRIEANHDSLNYPSAVEGSKGTSKMVEYNKALRGTIQKLRGLNEIYSNNLNSPELPKVIQSLDSMAQDYLKEINLYTKKFIDQNLTSMVSLVALYQQVAPQVYVLDQKKDLRYFVKVDSSLNSLFPESSAVRTLHEEVQALISQSGGGVFEEGNVAPEISLPAPDDKITSLSSTRGSVVLLDFWAAWCSPCRKENPNLVKAYNKYHSKGFNIFQVSLDKTKEDWLAGIKDDKLDQWVHVSDLKYWNSSVVSLYKIESIPFNLLLDKDGRVIATNLRGQALEEKLNEIFK
jgi:thiol-disulfide isomerase/thioredoxin